MPEIKQKSNPDRPPIVQEEERFYDGVKSCLEEYIRGSDYKIRLNRRLDELRTDLKQSARQDRGALMDQYKTALSLAEKADRSGFPDPWAPYFAHIRLEESDGVSDYFIGHVSFMSPENGIFILDWKSAPLARVYFEHHEGDFFSIPLPENRTRSGRLLFRRTVVFNAGRLIAFLT